ncbi:MAG TPA: OmpH family outer membrane protein [Bacteroidales bacterium]|nr:OmpH family outer membrane protein [Bacteroidales bacterium]
MQEENFTDPAMKQEAATVMPANEAKEHNGKHSHPLLMVSLILNLVLLVGLGVLYVLFFHSRRTQEAQVTPVIRNAPSGPARIVYLNLDTLNEKYEFVKNLRSDLESTGKKLQNEILSEQSAFEKDAAEFQAKVQSNAIAEDRAKVVYEELMQRQQLLADKKDKYTQQVADKEMNMNLRLLDTVTNFLKRYNRKFGYEYILGYKTAGEILLANDSLEITREVLDALNEEYNQRGKK